MHGRCIPVGLTQKVYYNREGNNRISCSLSKKLQNNHFASLTPSAFTDATARSFSFTTSSFESIATDSPASNSLSKPKHASKFCYFPYSTKVVTYFPYSTKPVIDEKFLSYAIRGNNLITRKR